MKEMWSATPRNTAVIRKYDGLISDMEKHSVVLAEDHIADNLIFDI